MFVCFGLFRSSTADHKTSQLTINYVDLICSHPICIIWPFREQHWTKLSISCTFLSSPHLTCGQRKHTKLFQHENYSMEAIGLGRHLWKKKKTTKGYIFKPLLKVFKLQILSGCCGLVLFSIEFYKVSKCAIASANFQFEPPGADQKTFYLYIFPFSDNIQQFPHNFFWKYWKIRSQYLDILSFWSILKVISWDEVFPGVIFTDREMSVLKKREISTWRFHLQKKM